MDRQTKTGAALLLVLALILAGDRVAMPPQLPETQTRQETQHG